MPDSKRYTVRDPESGRTVTFAWSGDTPPTDDDIAEVFAAAPQGEPALTRERQPAGAPSAMSAGHHPETLAGDDRQSKFMRMIEGAETPSDAAFLKRGPEVGSMLGMAFGGPMGAGIGAAAGSLAKGQMEQGLHMPTGGEAGTAALDGGFSALLAGAPRALAAGARTIGPAVARHAGALSKGVSALSGIGTAVASGNPLMGMGAGAATRALTSPSAIKAAGNLAGRAGAAIPEHAANKAGFGLLGADAFRKALLDALGADPASTVP
jgi:hypothetical protein